MGSTKTGQPIIDELMKQLSEVVSTKKCWSCECLHNALGGIESAFPKGKQPVELDSILNSVHELLSPVQYDCLGCKTCYAALITNAINLASDEHLPEPRICTSEKVGMRPGWPPLPGSYTVLRYQAPVAVCTLADEVLAASVACDAGTEIAIVGSLQTENLGIERLIVNVLINPNIRFLILCGADSQQNIGHLPGRSLIALARWGTDTNGTIINALGKRPSLRNITQEAIKHFRRTVRVIDLIGETQVPKIIGAAQNLSSRNTEAAEPFEPEHMVEPVKGYLPKRMVPDPTGYFVIFVDRHRQLISLEHYQNHGLLDAVIDGKTAAELYIPAIDKGLVSRLDHAAYLGGELARAEESLHSGNAYVQDAAPERCPTIITKVNYSCESNVQR